jgi:hypothetical protein
VAVLNIAPKTPDDGTVYSDGETSNKITITVKNAGQPVASTPFTGTVTDPSGRISGTVSPGTTDTNGDIVLTIGVPASPTGALSLTLYQDAQTRGSTSLVGILFDPVTLTLSPNYVSQGNPVVVTARIQDDAGIPVGGLLLTWQVDPSLGIADTSQTTQEAVPASFQYTLPALTQAQISALPGGQVLLQLTVGPVAGAFTTTKLLPTNPPLVAPTCPILYGNPPVIDDSFVGACADEGIPFSIPEIANSSVGDYVTLFTSPTGRSEDTTLLSSKLLDKASAGKPFFMFASLKGSAFTTNGPEYIYYTIFMTNPGNYSTTSDFLLVQVDRQDLSTLPDGNPDSRLTNPQATPTVYTASNYNNNDNFTATINANGTFPVKVGDVFTTKIYLLGYTTANLNVVNKIDSPPRTVTPADFDAFGNFVPFSVQFDYSLFKGIDGSNGQVYFILDRSGDLHRSPSRSIIVDTVPAYSGSIAHLLAL